MAFQKRCEQLLLKICCFNKNTTFHTHFFNIYEYIQLFMHNFSTYMNISNNTSPFSIYWNVFKKSPNILENSWIKDYIFWLNHYLSKCFFIITQYRYADKLWTTSIRITTQTNTHKFKTFLTINDMLGSSVFRGEGEYTFRFLF